MSTRFARSKAMIYGRDSVMSRSAGRHYGSCRVTLTLRQRICVNETWPTYLYEDEHDDMSSGIICPCLYYT